MTRFARPFVAAIAAVVLTTALVGEAVSAPAGSLVAAAIA